MPRLTPVVFLSMLIAPATTFGQGFDMPRADQPPQTQMPPAETADILERGMTIFMENLMHDMAPHLETLGQDMEGAANALVPAMRDIGTMMDDIRNYEMPQRLENGDIVIRRRADAPPPPPVSDRLNDLLTPRQSDPHPGPHPDPRDKGQTPPDSLRDLLQNLPKGGINL